MSALVLIVLQNSVSSPAAYPQRFFVVALCGSPIESAAVGAGI
jgi:hypothetical protein